jgi:hypothetical protein
LGICGDFVFAYKKRNRKKEEDNGMYILNNTLHNLPQKYFKY